MKLKAVERLTAVPQLISLNDVEVKDAILDCKKNFDAAKDVESIGSGAKLFQLDTPSGGYFFVMETSSREIHYLVRYKQVELSSKLNLPSGSSACRQVLVWRTTNSGYATGVAAKVFWKYLFHQYKVLVSDSQQSEKGKAFWQYQVQKAFETEHTVRLVNTNDWSFIELSSEAELNELAPKVWGLPDWFRRMVIVIY